MRGARGETLASGVVKGESDGAREAHFEETEESFLPSTSGSSTVIEGGEHFVQTHHWIPDR